ncbi:hypothetical protein GCM10025768_00260 [Microbacterium pseudoresistens]|uniref:Lipoprotein n=1 Tax=Microbacterium pseudoresistens TaxID=640634 RepID=A0A7Y9ETW1_9MICO|nr:hypothetical protein [Microbacterium pseudoresistens]NYD53862.1 hypothetical protein [Microbacterium pseudoresistens]
MAANRWVAMRAAVALAAGALALSMAGCAPAESGDPGAVDDSPSAGAAGESSPEPEAADPCTALAPSMDGLVDAVECGMDQPFPLGGTTALITDLGTTTSNVTASIAATLVGYSATDADVRAILHVEDPYERGVAPLALDPSAGADCLGDSGPCALEWDLSGTVFHEDLYAQLTAPQIWIQITDGTREVVVWVIRVDFTPS